MLESSVDEYGYNIRNELISAAKNAKGAKDVEYRYQYDDIGNRISSHDLGTNRTYIANNLNQYTSISNSAFSASPREEFAPQFDDDGNQTLIQTATGIWSVTYNGENRPILWQCVSFNSPTPPLTHSSTPNSATPPLISMTFDRMGRRVTKNDQRFVYDGYVCIQRLNAASNNAIDLVFTWDPSEPIATRPLVLQKYGQYNLFYTHDGNKNVSELVFFQQANGIAAHYEYAPFGAITAASRSTPVTAYDFREYNPFRFSSEYADDKVELVYYNYRHYNPIKCQWCSRDPLLEIASINLYAFCKNRNEGIDILGQNFFTDFFDDIKKTLEDTIDRTRNFVSGAVESITDVVNSSLDLLMDKAIALGKSSVEVANAVKSLLQTAMQKINDFADKTFGPCGSGISTIFVPNSWPGINGISFSDRGTITFSIVQVDFSDCCQAHDDCYVDGCEKSKCDNSRRDKLKEECDTKLSECMKQKFKDNLGGFAFTSSWLGDVYGWAVDTFGDNAFDNACNKK